MAEKEHRATDATEIRIRSAVMDTMATWHADPWMLSWCGDCAHVFGVRLRTCPGCGASADHSQSVGGLLCRGSLYSEQAEAADRAAGLPSRCAAGPRKAVAHV
jgi:hypothetical protein